MHKKKRNKRNIPEGISYNTKKKTKELMDKYMKIAENVAKIIKVSGFYVTAPGDPSVGINPATWEINNEFYFDNKEELEEFRREIKQLFEFHCGEITTVVTFEEQQALLDAEDQMMFDQYPVRYLIKEGDNYKQAGSTATYSSSVGNGIHLELPHWISENGTSDREVIKSTEPRFKQILLKEAERLENEIRNEEYRLMNAKRNLSLIQQELKYGQK